MNTNQPHSTFDQSTVKYTAYIKKKDPNRRWRLRLTIVLFIFAIIGNGILGYFCYRSEWITLLGRAFGR